MLCEDNFELTDEGFCADCPLKNPTSNDCLDCPLDEDAEDEEE